MFHLFENGFSDELPLKSGFSPTSRECGPGPGELAEIVLWELGLSAPTEQTAGVFTVPSALGLRGKKGRGKLWQSRLPDAGCPTKPARQWWVD